ncbi:MAG: ATP-dependent zinc metalloprotease FtsH [Deltaproteobacteria bacterium]|nr:MAG: ATP-dependent zinc metalloprotease FtsH [Deltaproteobacteria bacterium]
MTPSQKYLPLVGLALLIFFLGWVAFSMVPPGGSVTWDALKVEIEAGRIEEVLIEEHRVRACGPAEIGGRRNCMSAVRVPMDDGFVPLLDAHGVKYQAAPPQACSGASLSFFLLPLLILLGFWFFMTQREGGRGGAAAFSRSSARLVPEEGTGVTFDDVAGVDEAAEELQEIVSFLQTPEKFTALGGRPPKGVLLVGPPGTGKTLLARAVAGEAGVSFLTISGSDFVEMFVGVGAARVRDLFKTGQEHAPCIIFIDELDAVGKARGGGGPGGNEEREQTLNQLLVELDGFDNRRGIIVMAATNRPETLDTALLRPGRFDRQVLVDRPDFKGRLKILQVHARQLKLSADADLDEIARMTPGFAGADLANALNEAALLAARREARSISTADIKEAIERVVAGLEKKSRRLSAAEKRVVAYHELGHAICAAASPGADPVTKISIIPRGVSALGYTMQLPLEDRYLMTKTELLNRLTVLYGGRAAEELIFGDVTTGAHDDIKRATELARRMVTEFGMSKRIGAVRYGGESENPWGFSSGNRYGVSPDTGASIDTEIRTLLQRCHERARTILRDNHALLEEMAVHLIETEVLEGDVMQGFLERAEQADSLEDRPTAEWISEGQSLQAPPPPAEDLPPRAGGAGLGEGDDGSF